MKGDDKMAAKQKPVSVADRAFELVRFNISFAPGTSTKLSTIKQTATRSGFTAEEVETEEFYHAVQHACEALCCDWYSDEGELIGELIND